MSADLTTCNGFDQQYCIIKLIQAILSFLLLCFCLVEIVIEIKIKGRLTINTKLAVEFLISFSLLFNLLHQIFDPLRIILFIHLFFTNIFYVTIFYYVGENVLETQAQKMALIAFYVFMIIVYVVILILRIVFSHSGCTTSLYLVVDCFTLLVSFLIFYLYYKKDQQQSRIHRFYSESLITVPKSERVSSLSTPFKKMWILIFTYIFCGIVNLIETILLFTVYSSTCQFTSNENTSTLIKFLFDIFDYYIGCLITLIIFRLMRIAETPNTQSNPNNLRSRELSFSNASVVQSNKLQLVANLSVSNRTSQLD